MLRPFTTVSAVHCPSDTSVHLQVPVGIRSILFPYHIESGTRAPCVRRLQLPGTAPGTQVPGTAASMVGSAAARGTAVPREVPRYGGGCRAAVHICTDY
jgi:hypothetical protein